MRAISWEGDPPGRAEHCDRGRSRPQSPASGLLPPSRLSPCPNYPKSNYPTPKPSPVAPWPNSFRAQTDPQRKPIGAHHRAMSRSLVLGKNHHSISGDVRHHAALHGLKLLSKIHKSIKDSVLSQNQPIGTRPATPVTLSFLFKFLSTPSIPHRIPRCPRPCWPMVSRAGICACNTFGVYHCLALNGAV